MNINQANSSTSIMDKKLLIYYSAAGKNKTKQKQEDKISEYFKLNCFKNSRLKKFRSFFFLKVFAYQEIKKLFINEINCH